MEPVTAIIVALLAWQAVAPQPGRYSQIAVGTNIVKMDTANGTATVCKVEGGKVACP